MTIKEIEKELKNLEEKITSFREERDRILISKILDKLEYGKYYRISANSCEIILFKYTKENIELAKCGLRIKKCLKEVLTLSSSSTGVHFNYSLSLLPRLSNSIEIKEISEDTFFNKINEITKQLNDLKS